jgi:hypothetical protein
MHIFSPRFLTHESATHDPLVLTSTTRMTRSAGTARATHALHTSLAAVVVPAQGQIVHEEHDRLVVGECLNLNTAQAAEVVREVNVLQLAVFEVRACRQLDLSVVSLHVVTNLGVPGRAGDVEDAGFRTVVVTTKPSALSVEPEGGQAIVGTIRYLARIGARNNSRHTSLVPVGIVGAIAGC